MVPWIREGWGDKLGDQKDDEWKRDEKNEDFKSWRDYKEENPTWYWKVCGIREREREREDVNDLLGSIEWPKKLALKLIFGLQSNLKYIAKPQYKRTCLCIIQYVKFIDLIWSIW